MKNRIHISEIRIKVLKSIFIALIYPSVCLSVRLSVSIKIVYLQVCLCLSLWLDKNFKPKSIGIDPLFYYFFCWCCSFVISAVCVFYSESTKSLFFLHFLFTTTDCIPYNRTLQDYFFYLCCFSWILNFVQGINNDYRAKASSGNPLNHFCQVSNKITNISFTRSNWL